MHRQQVWRIPKCVRNWEKECRECGRKGSDGTLQKQTKVTKIKSPLRFLVYLIPGNLQFEVSIVLGNRAASLALSGDLRAETMKLISEARGYAEGRGVRFVVRSSEDIEAVVQLVRFKVTPP
jgi:hypothetical protein